MVIPDRIQSVDVLRGFSLLGILLLNIVSFGLPFASYMNPSVYGDNTGWNHDIWVVAITMWDGKMRAIFSMLFGTSAVILLERAESRGAGIDAADIYYRRALWLILIGLLHAHLIWFGDILYGYGVVGLLLFPLRKLSARALIISGVAIIAVHSLQNVGAGIGIQELKTKAESGGTTLEARRAKTEWTQVKELFEPPKDVLEEDLKAHRGGWIDNLKLRSGQAAMFQFTMFFQFLFLDVLGMLVLGMGLAKAGVFSASLGYGFYATLAVVGFALGAPLNYWAATKWAAGGYSIPGFFTYLGATADPGRFLVAAGYIGVIMMMCKSGRFGFVTTPLAAVGRLALSNYLLTSIVCTLLFNGYGLGWFGHMARFDLYKVVLCMWAVNLVASSLWVRWFRYGPAEWAWRSLTYWRKQPMRLIPAAE